MPASPLFYKIFELLDNDDEYGTGRDMAFTYVKIILRCIVRSLHRVAYEDGNDYEVNLLEFWKYLVRLGEKDNYFHFAGGKYYEITFSEYDDLDMPLCIFARIIYRNAAAELSESKVVKKVSFFYNPGRSETIKGY